MRFKILFSYFDDDINILSEYSGHLNADLEPCDPQIVFMVFFLVVVLGDYPKGTCT